MAEIEQRLAKVETEQTRTEQILSDMRDAVREVAQVTKKLELLEHKYSDNRDAFARIGGAVDRLEKELQEIKMAIPALQETRRWVVTGMLAIIGIVFAALLGGVILSKPSAPLYYAPAPYQQQQGQQK